MNYKIRWMTKSDMDSVVQIEEKSFPKPWRKKDFIDCLQVTGKIGKVIEKNNKIIGFIIYELLQKGFYVINVAIDPDYRRCGYGKALLSQLIEKIKHSTDDADHSKRYYVNAYISEDKYEAHLFFRSMNFKAISVEKNFFNDEDGDFDAYHFVYKLSEPKNQYKYASNSLTHDKKMEGIE